MKVNEESEKFALKLSIPKTKVMASGPITSWQIDGEAVEIVADFVWLQNHCRGWLQRVTAAMKSKDGYSLEGKLWPSRQHIKSGDIPLPKNVRLIKAMVIPVVMYGCEGWTIKKAEHWRIDAFELWCWKRLLRVPWTARRPKQFILKKSVLNIHWKNGCWSWNSNTLATWCEKLTHWKRPWCWERLKVEEEGDNRGWEGWKASSTQWTEFEQTPEVGDGQGGLACCSPWGHKESDMTERLNWINHKRIFLS